MPEISPALREEVRSRGRYRCEYCLISEELALIRHEVDHIIAVKHGGASNSDNLALSCTLCNRHKGSDLASIDSETGALLRLFHPRRDRWDEHFELRGPMIVAHSGIGRATIRLLQLNLPQRIKEREAMIQAGLLRVTAP